jgi:hypothetical protein
MLLAGSLAVASEQAGNAYGIEALNDLSIALIFGSALVVAGAVVYTTVVTLRRESPSTAAGE